MAIELQQHYVAFLDVLGFSAMVQEDIGNVDHPHLTKLFRCHQRAAHVFSNDPGISITQFSDSIVISKLYDPKEFAAFATNVAKYQRLLLDEELLCRGGIAVNKHFSNGSFTFSAGVIDAYKVESESARYPRVVIDPEVMALVFPDKKSVPTGLVREDDGLYFLDYLGQTRRTKPAHLRSVIESLVASSTANDSASIREKGLWLAAYSDAVLGTSLRPPKFRK